MKKKAILIIVFILLILATIIFVRFFYPIISQSQILEEELSSNQKQIKELFGDPKQFVITYLPRGGDDDPQLVRNEVWLYPDQGKKVSFLAGKIISSEDYETQDSSATSLKPEDFHFYQNYEDIAKILGKDKVNEFYDMPGFEDDPNIKIYASELAMFIIENDHLTYFQTFSIGPEADQEKTEENEIDEVTTDVKTYISSDFGFQIKYPKDWFIEYGVLTNYDTNYLSEGKSLPEKIIKCDFNKFDPKTISIKDPELLVEKPVRISEGIAKEVIKTQGPGLGDGVIFLFEQEGFDPISLLCFSHSSSLEDQLVESLKSFEFIKQ